MRGAVGTDSTAVAVPLVTMVRQCLGLPHFGKNCQRCQWFIVVNLSHFGQHVIMVNRFCNNNPVPLTSSWLGQLLDWKQLCHRRDSTPSAPPFSCLWRSPLSAPRSLVMPYQLDKWASVVGPVGLGPRPFGRRRSLPAQISVPKSAYVSSINCSIKSITRKLLLGLLLLVLLCKV